MPRLLPLNLLLTTVAMAAACSAELAAGGPSTFPVEPANPPIEGVLTTEGVECPAMRGSDGTLYTLTGDLGGFGPGDRVCIVPSYVEMSFCMQGTTVHVDWIGKAPCPMG